MAVVASCSSSISFAGSLLDSEGLRLIIEWMLDEMSFVSATCKIANGFNGNDWCERMKQRRCGPRRFFKSDQLRMGWTASPSETLCSILPGDDQVTRSSFSRSTPKQGAIKSLMALLSDFRASELAPTSPFTVK